MKVHLTISIYHCDAVWEYVCVLNVRASTLAHRTMAACRHQAVTFFPHALWALENDMCTCCMMLYAIRLPLSSIFNFLWWCRKATKKHRRTHNIMETKWKIKRYGYIVFSLVKAHHMTDVSIYKNALYPPYLSHLPALRHVLPHFIQLCTCIHVCSWVFHVLRTP